MKLNENTSVAMPIKNMIGIIFAVAMGVWAWADITSRLTSLETAKQLMEQDLLEASTQKPIDQEQFMLLEHMAIQLEKITTRVNITASACTMNKSRPFSACMKYLPIPGIE